MNAVKIPLLSAINLAPVPGGNRPDHVKALFVAYERKVFAQTNRLFWWLLIFQWAFGVFIAAIWTPETWTGTQSSIHPHLIAAVLLGGLLVSLPLMLLRWVPFHPITRHTVAVAQVSFSALLIHLTGGRIETHFHIFGSLAFIALYRDWRVLPTATLMVVLDHLLLGRWFPQSVYGVPFATIWRTAEHAGWVLFEDVVLVWACFVSQHEMREICRRQDAHQQLLEGLEQRVLDRTTALETEIAAREQTALELIRSEERHRALIENLPIGVFETTHDGRVLLANPYLLKLLGLPLDLDLAKLNMTEGDIIAAHERQRLWDRLRAEREVRGFETTFRTSTGETIEVMMHAHCSNDRDGAFNCEGTIEDVTARKNAAREVDALHHRLVTASRQAGMADVANGVLHNVGNVLTSVNITVHDVLDRLRSSRLSHLHRAIGVINRERAELANFLTTDPQGRQLPDFLIKLEAHLSEENQKMRTDVEGLVNHFEHIREIIVTQQDSAKLCAMTENVAPAQLFEDAIKLLTDSLHRHGIQLERRFCEAPTTRADRHKVLQVLVNLLKNAKDALVSHAGTGHQIRLEVALAGDSMVALSVEDNGPGIARENLAKIFQHGFTTKEDGHGFGLHSAALAAREMGGDLRVTNVAHGTGARFTLLLPQSIPVATPL